VRLELFHRQFASIAEQMGAALGRTALSTNVKERLDYSCAVFDGDGALVANAPHIPVHLGGMGTCVRRMVEIFGPLAPGDVVITNDPFEGGSHLPDVTVVTPVHLLGQSVPAFFVASRAHHAEIGGIRPGSMAPAATSLAEEGVLIRPFKLFDRGESRLDALHKTLTQAPYPSRRPDENLADTIAQVAANHRGAQLLVEMTTEHGVDVVRAYMRHIRAASAQKMRSALRQLPPGTYHRCESLDDGTLITVALTLTPDGAVLDFTGSGPVHPGNLNANPAIVASAVLYCLRCLLREDIPLNDGVLAPVRLIIPPGILNPPATPDPRQCPAVGGGNVETSQRIVDAIFGALGIVAASQGTMNNLLIGTPQFGYYETIAGGAGAGPAFDGADAVHTHMTNTRLTDPEVLESRYPLRVVRFAIRRGSGGAGRHRGGDGVIREIEFLAPAEVSILSQRRTTQPYGLAGGAPGVAGRNLLQQRDGTQVELGPLAQFLTAGGDRLTIETPGGGGYGAPP
jgi:5-oxoprolinase (ATP-hydrolysing)